VALRHPFDWARGDTVNGWIKLHRKLIYNPVFQKEELLKLFIYCLICAGHKQQRIIFLGKEEVVAKGSFITGRKELSKELKQTESKIYRGLKILNDLNIISMQTNNKFTLINVVNYNTYQGSDSEIEQPANSGLEKVTQITNGCTVKSNNKKEAINTDTVSLSEKNKLQPEQPANNQRTTSEQPANTNKNLRTKELKKEDIKNKDLKHMSALPSDFSPEFETFWKAYPNFNRNKKGAFKAYQVCLKGEGRLEKATPDLLLNAAKRYSEQVKYKDKQYVLHATTFLGKDERWAEWKNPQSAQSLGGYQRTEQEEAERKADIARWASMREEDDTPK